MRETSYFNQQTDEEAKKENQQLQAQDAQSLSQLISISNQQESNQNNQDESLNGPPADVTSTNNESQSKINKRHSGFGSAANDDGISDNSNPSKNKDGIQMFKISSRSQMKQRAQRASKKSQGLVIGVNGQTGSQFGDNNAIGSPLNFKNFDTPISPGNISGSQENSLLVPNRNTFLKDNTLFDADGLMRSQSFKIGDQQTGGVSPLQIDKKQKTDLKIQNDQKNLVQNIENSAEKIISERDMKEIKQNQIQQLQNNNVTGNFGRVDLNLQKQMSQETQKHNYSVLKGPKGEVEDETEMKLQQQQMFTSMSDIGFPSNIHQKQSSKKHPRKTGEIITTEQIQKMMDTQNNWRVRTMTIDELLHDVQDRIETDIDYILINSEKLIDFFIQLLTDQNFKVVLNTLNILNMIVGIKDQQFRHIKIMKQEVKEPWGISNATLSRYIPQIVKKLADSKNIIRQEAFKCLFSIGDIMKSGLKKDNNFIALILPYLNNSSNWHIREELLNLLIKCFLKSQDPMEFDAYQILDSILQLFNDTKEKIRNLALEAIAAFASKGFDTKINEILFQLKVSKDICDLIMSRLEYGQFPFINQEGNIEVPYQQDVNYEVDSVAHNMSQQNGENIRRKQSVSGNSVHNQSNNVNLTLQRRGNSSGRKIVVTTAKVSNQQLGVQYKDEIMQQKILNSKRTASANNPNQFEFESNQIITEPVSATLAQKNAINDPVATNFSYSVGVTKGSGQGGILPIFDESQFQIQDFNSSSFLPQLQKINMQLQGGSYQSNQSQNYAIPASRDRFERDIGSSGANMAQAFDNMWDNNLDPNLNSSNYQYNIPISGSSKRSNKYLHGTPAQNSNAQQYQQYSRGHSGQRSSHQMNNSISNQSPSLYQQQRVMGKDMMLVNDQFDIMSNAGTNYAQYQQTPGSTKEQILLSAGGYRGSSGHFNHGELSNFTTLGQVQGNVQNQLGFTPQPHVAHPGSLYAYNQSHYEMGVADPGFSEHNQEMFRDQYAKVEPLQKQYQQRIIQQQMTGAKKNQATFYSDGTTFTAQTAQTSQTATTGATSKVTKKFSRGHIVENQQQQMQINSSIGPGPVKATRAVLMYQNNMIAQEDLCIDTRDNNRKSKSTGKHKMNIKLQNSQDVKKLKRDQDDESADENEMGHNLYNRSFSHIEKGKFGFDKQNSNLGENIQDDPALITQSSKIKYETTEELEPLDKPDKEFKKCIQGIQSPDWFNQFDACNIIRRVCKHHQSLILQTGNIQNLVNTLVKLAESLRSAVARIALMTLADMFYFLKRVIEPCLLPIVKILLKKGTDTNHFIAEEADKCLRNMVENCQESKVLQIILMQNTNSRSNIQRLKICQCLMHIVKQLGNNILFFKENDKLLVQLAKYLQDASQDVRQVSKGAFIAMSQAIMGQNELEKLLQRVLNEAQYQKVKEFLDKEPIHLMQNYNNNDFVITNANKIDQNCLKKSSKISKSSIKSIRNERQKTETLQGDQQDLKIESKSILNPAFLNKNESSGFLNRVALQKYKLDDDQHFNETVKDLIAKSQVNEWKYRLECSDTLFELIRENIERFQSKQFKNVELADSLCKLITDQNVKIQLSCLENLNKVFSSMFQFVESFIQIFYKSIITNLGSSHIGVRKNSEQLLKQINDNLSDKLILVQPLMNMIQYNSNARLKPALIDQLNDLLETLQEKDCQSLILLSTLSKIVLPVGFKLLDDNKTEVKSRVEKLFKKLYFIIGQQMLDQCPQLRLQRVCDICLTGQQKNLSGTGSSGKNSQGQTGNFGANGSSLPLNSRI